MFITGGGRSLVILNLIFELVAQYKERFEPSFIYDDFEEVWESDKGVFIEMDAETNKVRWISVYISELDLENFEDCKW